MSIHNSEYNKQVVKRFNKEVIELGNRESFESIMHPDFVNQTAPANTKGSEGMWNTFANVLQPAFPDLTVEIYDQIAEGDKVVTRKSISGTHQGQLFDIAPTGRKIKIDVIDIVRVKDGKYFEHWGINTLQSVLAELRKA